MPKTIDRPREPRRGSKKPLPKPEGRRHGRKDDFDPHKKRDYHGGDGDAVDPQRTGPGT